MGDVLGFGVLVGLVGLAGLLAVASNRISEWIRVPAPAIFFLVAAAVSDVVPALNRIPVLTVQRIVTVMLVVLLFDGGMHIGGRRFRSAAGTVLWIGVVGTLVTTLGVAAVAHWVLGFDGLSSLLLGVALAPTDPAVVFSVLGRREITGRSGTVLEGESGANDPVGIAAMAALLAVGTGGHGGWGAILDGVGEFVVQMVVGGVVGVGGGLLLSVIMRRIALPSAALYPLRTLLAAAVVYGVATAAHGSGFLAVFVAGIVVGDVRAPFHREIRQFHSSLASLAEIVAFVLLGFTVSVGKLGEGRVWLAGLVLAVLLALVVRPLLVGLLLWPIRLGRGERVFVLWSGLKGAVPILLGTYLLSAGVPGAQRLYQVVVIVVVFSVVVQGGLAPLVARRAGVPMRVVAPAPWSLGLRFTDEPEGAHRYVLATGAAAEGRTLTDLAVAEHVWISLINRDGALVAATGDTALRAGDEVVALADAGADLGPLFSGPG